jgi:PAS domain S-box-containing protein
VKSVRTLLQSVLGPVRALARGLTRPPRILGRESWAYILASAAGVVILGCFLYLHITSSYHDQMAYWRERQLSVADDRARRVSAWLEERRADAELFATRPSIRAALRTQRDSDRLSTPSAAPEHLTRILDTDLTAILDDTARLYGYAGAYLLDHEARVVAQSSTSVAVSPELVALCKTVARTGAFRIDLFGDVPDKTLISFSVPVFPARSSTRASHSPRQPLGVGILVAEASKTLFPILTRDAVPTRTGETILARREGNEIVFFSPLRHVPANSPNLRFSLPTAPLPARAALEGREIFLQAKDYRGASVLASTQHIGLIGWGLIRKIDRAEALEGFHEQAVVEGLAAGLLILVLGALLWNHRRYVLTRVLKQESEKFRRLLESAPDSMVVADSEGRIVLANARTEKMFAYPREELLGQPIEILVAGQSRPEYRERFHRHSGDLSYQHSGPCMESLGLRKDGSEFPIEVLMTPLGSPEGVLLISAIRDITERQRAEKTLAASEVRYRRLFESANDGILILDAETGMIVDVNPFLIQLLGSPREHFLTKHIWDIGFFRDIVANKAYFEELQRKNYVCYENLPLETADGRSIEVEFVSSVYQVDDKMVVQCNVRDLTERKRAQEELRRVNRALKTLSECNQAVVRSKEESELLQAVCRILVRDGGHRLAWVGYAEQDEAKSVRPVAYAGVEEGYLETVEITWADTERGRGPTGTAFRTRRPCLAKNILTDPAFAPWRTEASKRGYASVVGLPLIADTEPLGVLTIYAAQPEAFDAEELKLLAELSGDLAYGIQALRTRAERERAEELLLRRNVLLQRINSLLLETLTCETEADVARTCLAMAEEITQSKFGYVDEINPEGRVDTIALSDPGWQACKMPQSEAVRLLKNLEISSYWGRALKEGKSQIVNDPASDPDRVGTPEGHPPITSFLGVPLKIGARTIGLIGLANKEPGYTLADQQDVEALSVAFVEALNRMRAEEALKESEERFRTLVENSTVGIYRTTLDGRILMTNPTLIEMLGYESFTDLAKRDLEREGFEPGYPRMAFIERVKREGEVKGLESAWTKRDGTVIFVRESARAVRAEDGTVLYYDGAVEDITERKRAEEEIRKLNDELEHRVAQRTCELVATNKELEAFTYSVSHDLRAPLRHIDGFSKLLLEDFSSELPKEAKHYLTRVREGSQRMGQMVDELLALTRLGRTALKVQMTGLDSLVKEVRRELQSDVAGREIEWRISPLPFVECDPALLKQVFANLLSNAVKFTRPRQRAVVEVGATMQDGSPVTFVRDNGVGFSMKYADKLFGIFQRLHRQEDFEGTGVGLAIVARIIHKHGGRVWAEGELNRGATFYFSLGAAEGRATNNTG